MSIKQMIKVKTAANTILVILFCVLVFHLLVLVGFIPFDTVWGGRLETQSQMYVFETVSIIINTIIMLVVSMKAGYIKAYLHMKIINTILWFLVVLFTLNTAGNILAMSWLETLIFTPLTLISAFLFYRMAIEK
ncbi:MAG: hypothetical protein COB79_00140 [Zetaproteobacteria bacterium]|nr:MAG: hypothetical protein COB79_00140 [Zetaproteobacteria bacterium]